MREQEQSAGSVTEMFGTHHVAIRLCGPVTTASIFALVDAMERGVGYYQYRRVDIEIDSPGGEVRALDYYLNKLDGMRRRIPGLIIGTLAMTEASSAAAQLLSLGTVGYRRAYASTTILYHNSRIPFRQSVLTQTDMESLAQQLKEADDAMQVRLLDHLFGGRSTLRLPSAAAVAALAWQASDLDERSREEAAAVMTALFLHDKPITPGQARDLCLIDRIEEPHEAAA